MAGDYKAWQTYYNPKMYGTWDLMIAQEMYLLLLPQVLWKENEIN